MKLDIFLVLLWKLVIVALEILDEDPYKILGLKKSFTQEELELQYRKLVKIHQPELGGDIKIFNQIKQSYKNLKEDYKKSQNNSQQPLPQVNKSTQPSDNHKEKVDPHFDPYKVLDVSKDTNFKQIELQYKRLIKLHQPENHETEKKITETPKHKNPEKDQTKEYNPYRVLGLWKGIDMDALERTYRKLLLENDPDLGGDPQKYNDIKKAYATIQDREDRRIQQEEEQEKKKKAAEKDKRRKENEEIGKILEDMPEFTSSNVRYKLYEAGLNSNLPSTKVQIVGTITIGFIVIVIWFLCRKLPERPPVVITRRRRYEDNRTWEYQGEEEWHENSEPSEVERLLARLLVMYNYPWTIQVPASHTVIDSLPRIPVNDEVFETECPICLISYGEERRNAITQLECGHMFHRDCAIDWLLVSNTCPYCRHEYPTDNQLYLEYHRLMAEAHVQQDEEPQQAQQDEEPQQNIE
uniref:J domain-containing protein n=1 Tax=Acrobeloides nanus TaxID=290746 RepID=A0A914DFA3_9BILA